MKQECASVLATAAGICTALAALILLAPPSFGAEPSTSPRFVQAGPGDFTFDTATLRGRLHPGGKSLGLVSVVHVPSGKRLDSSNGLLSHYRVFTQNTRYGGGAWDWPSAAELLSDGAVVVRWGAGDRPFEMQATYRWRNSRSIDVETAVRAQQDLSGFESFLANYFSESFTNAAVYVGSSANPQSPARFLPLMNENGDWQMFPARSEALRLIQDTRWNLQPNPVDWTVGPTLEKPIGVRRDPVSGLAVVLASPASDCFAISSPHQTEPHRSLYLSLIGKDLKAGETAVARVRLTVLESPTEAQILESTR